VLERWDRQHIDAGIWWLRSRADLASAQCWLRRHQDQVTLATRAGDAPRLHTEGRRAILLGILDSRPEELAALHAAGVRFARAPETGSTRWMAEASRLGFAMDVSQAPAAEVRSWLARDAPALIFHWERRRRATLDRHLMTRLARARGGVILVTATDAGTKAADMHACLRSVTWPHCAIGSTADADRLSRDLLASGYTEGNLSRMFGFNMLRVLQSAEIWSGQR
jgi:microsomal dipeptidase-like Zn-dependent dipeptidase